ncbi:DUF3307 domain-containing protein [Methanolapillus millepedarum]|uniref:DUF3307 domain-containing protein n=1 Tax=Methanolapillus millepedarum TaxID=3028296 RepID=A0AA96ZUT7_9EURY|nr:hypothetical protein MsAc7_02050 [Methanosarcinaceae archaeon Ac7]
MDSEIFKFYLFVFLFCHVIGDYYLQTEKLAGEKENNYKKALIHCLLYSIPFLAFLMFYLIFPTLTEIPKPTNSEVIAIIITIAGIVLSHASIDLIKLKWTKKTADAKNETLRNAYIIDQVLHLSIILAAALWLSAETVSKTIDIMISSADLYLGFKIVLFSAIILKPANVSFKKIFLKYQPPKSDATENPTIIGAGATIGSLERLLMGFFMIINQFAAVGLIMTAKSIARYDRISKDPSFAEYYLIGTLYSILITLMAYLLIFR